jgi:hypothetical protein
MANLQTASIHIGGYASQVPGVPDREEILQLLSTAVRAGSVSAMKELLRWYERQSPDRKRRPLDGLTSLPHAAIVEAFPFAKEDRLPRLGAILPRNDARGVHDARPG